MPGRLVFIGAAVFAAALILLLLASEESASRATRPTTRKPDVEAPRASAAAPPARSAVPARPVEPPPPAGEEQRATFADDIAAWRVTVERELLLRADRLPPGERDRQARAAARAAQREQRERVDAARRTVLDAARADPALARELVTQLLGPGLRDEEAFRMARTLRYLGDATPVAQLVELVERGTTPRERQVGMIGLEGRPVGEWLAPVARVFREDVEPALRDHAGGMLGRALADTGQRTAHPGLRGTLLVALESDDAATRSRTLRALLHERAPTSAVLDAVRAHLDDRDETVRADAAITLRVLEQR